MSLDSLRTSTEGSSLKAIMIRQGSLLLMLVPAMGLLILTSCGFNTNEATRVGPDPPPTREDCRPTFVKVNEKPIEVTTGAWRFGVDAFLIGCEADLTELTAEDRESVVDFVASEIEKASLAFFSASRNPVRRAAWVEQINAGLDAEGVTDLLVVGLYSAEHRPQ